MASAFSCRVGRCASSGAATLVPHCARCTTSSCSTCGVPIIATSAAPALPRQQPPHHASAPQRGVRRAPSLADSMSCRSRGSHKMDHPRPGWGQSHPGPTHPTNPEQSHTAPAVQCCRTLLHAPIAGCGCGNCINDNRVAVRCGGQPGGSRLSDDVLLEAGGSEGGLADAQRCVKVRSLSRSRLRSQQLAIEKRKRQSLMQRRVKDTRDD